MWTRYWPGRLLWRWARASSGTQKALRPLPRTGCHAKQPSSTGRPGVGSPHGPGAMWRAGLQHHRVPFAPVRPHGQDTLRELRRPRLWSLRPVQAWARRHRLRTLRGQGLCELPQRTRFQGSRLAGYSDGALVCTEGRLFRRRRRARAPDPRLCSLHRHNAISPRFLFIPANES
jgi:hypothetical protein